MGVNLNTGLNAQQRGWSSGWPHCNANAMVWVKAGGIGVSLNRGIADLIEELMDETVKRGYKLDKQKDDWGYACRAITGSTTIPSNHSWGLAIDINAIHNPYGDHLVTDMPKWMPHLWAQYGFRWGGTYSGHKDAMHYEFMGTPGQAKKLAKKAKRDFADPNHHPKPKPDPKPIDPLDPPKLTLLERLRAAGRLIQYRARHHGRPEPK